MQQRPEEILKKARERKKLKQQDVADKIGMTLRQYNKYEAGEFPKFKTDSIKAIDQLLGTKLYELIYEQKEARDESVHLTADRDKLIIEMLKEIIRLNARVDTLTITLADIVSKVDKKAIAAVDAELTDSSNRRSEALLDEWKKKVSGLL
jgi:transcriptional regulator with XRE-family HTH domain